MKYSIVIPTYNRLSFLKNCLKSIASNTNINNDIEIIVVSNGCTDGTPEYVKSLGEPYKLLYWPEPLGYSNATNLGYNVAKGKYVIRLDSDSEIIGGGWINLLEDPFNRFPTAGISGPSVCPVWDSDFAADFAISFCTMIKSELFCKIGYLDPVFNVGGGEDTDFCMRAQLAGYTVHKAGYFLTSNPGDTDLGFPVYHMPSMIHAGEDKTRLQNKAYSLNLLKLRYGKIKL